MKNTINKIKELLGKPKEQPAPELKAKEDRPIKFVPDGVNSWRIVWAEVTPVAA